MASSLLQEMQQKSTKDKFCDRDLTPTGVDHQFYNYFNQTSTMSLLNPQFIAHQTAALLSGWPFHSIPYPSPLFSGWPMMQSAPFETKPLISPILSHHEKHNNNNNNYLEENHNEMELKVKKNQSYTSHASTSTPISSPASHSSDSIESSEHKKEQQSHGKNKIFTCKVCDKTFGYKHVLQNHEKTHTGEKAHMCCVCNKRFRRDHHLKVHMRLHSGEKPFRCSHPNCDRQFVQVANLRRHMKTHDEKTTKDVEKVQMSEVKVLRASHGDDCFELTMKRHASASPEYDYYSTIAEQYPEQTEPEDLSMHTSKKKNC